MINQCSRLCIQVRENLLDYKWILNTGDDLNVTKRGLAPDSSAALSRDFPQSAGGGICATIVEA